MSALEYTDPPVVDFGGSAHGVKRSFAAKVFRSFQFFDFSNF
jgi:hypothetical protein